MVRKLTGEYTERNGKKENRMRSRWWKGNRKEEKVDDNEEGTGREKRY